MNLFKLSRLPLAGLLLIVPTALMASAEAKISFHPLISMDSKNCYSDAVLDADHGRFQPALAKLESMLMVDPVTVGIDKGTVPAGVIGYDAAVAKGMAIWRTSLPDSPYTASKPHLAPMVVVRFVKEMPEQGDDLQGMIEAQHEFKWNGTEHESVLKGTLYVVYRVNDRNLSQREVSEVVAHELGHLLGLTDAPTPSGLMGPFVAGSPRLSPSKAEIDALQQLRQVLRDEIDHIEDQL